MIDQAKVIDAIVSQNAAPTSKEEAARLVDGWVERTPDFPEVALGWKVLGVEQPFYVELGQKTYVIGVMDALFADSEGIVQGEWKTRRAPKLKKDGTNYAGDDEDGWLEEISNGAQLALYALAGAKGFFVSSNGLSGAYQIASPRIMVRALIKSTPSQVWPARQWEKGVFQFHAAGIEATEAAIQVKAEQIRTARKMSLVPWQLPGMQCENKYRRVCGQLEKCKQHLYQPMRPVGAPMDVDASDPRKRVYDILGLDPDDREVVMLSASGYGTYSECMEKGRVQYETDGPERESSFELEVGGCFHAGVAALYTQLMEAK